MYGLDLRMRNQTLQDRLKRVLEAVDRRFHRLLAQHIVRVYVDCKDAESMVTTRGPKRDTVPSEWHQEKVSLSFLEVSMHGVSRESPDR